MLVALLTDFSEAGPATKTKMALWLLWIDTCCDSPYWRETLDSLPQPADMPQVCLDSRGGGTLPACLGRHALAGMRRVRSRSWWRATGGACGGRAVVGDGH